MVKGLLSCKLEQAFRSQRLVADAFVTKILHLLHFILYKRFFHHVINFTSRSNLTFIVV